MVTAGVATMFYGRAVAKKFKNASKRLSSGEEERKEKQEDRAIEDAVTIPLLGALLGR